MRVSPFVFVGNEYLALLLVEKQLQNPIFISLAINAEKNFQNADSSPRNPIPPSLARSKATPSCDKETSSAYAAACQGVQPRTRSDVAQPAIGFEHLERLLEESDVQVRHARKGEREFLHALISFRKVVYSHVGRISDNVIHGSIECLAFESVRIPNVPMHIRDAECFGNLREF